MYIIYIFITLQNHELLTAIRARWFARPAAPFPAQREGACPSLPSRTSILLGDPSQRGDDVLASSRPRGLTAGSAVIPPTHIILIFIVPPAFSEKSDLPSHFTELLTPAMMKTSREGIVVSLNATITNYSSFFTAFISTITLLTRHFLHVWCDHHTSYSSFFTLRSLPSGPVAIPRKNTSITLTRVRVSHVAHTAQLTFLIHAPWTTATSRTTIVLGFIQAHYWGEDA